MSPLPSGGCAQNKTPFDIECICEGTYLPMLLDRELLTCMRSSDSFLGAVALISIVWS